MNGVRRGRTRLFALILTAWAAVVVARLVQIQIAQGSRYRARAARQQERRIEIAGSRGSILDREGRELAVSVEASSVYAIPDDVQKPRVVAETLAPLLDMPAGEILDKLGSEKGFVWLRRQVDTEAAEKIRALKLPGIHFVVEPRRFYPKGHLAAAVLGFVGTDGSGLAGLEHLYDKSIRGKPGEMVALTDARRSRYGEAETANSRPAQAGASLVLSLDSGVQFAAEHELAAAMAEHRAKSGSVVVLDPWNGEILAMASAPDFDPNDFGRYPAESRRNRVIADSYEPGSTFKIVTGALALEEGVVSLDEIIDTGDGTIRVANTTIQEAKGHRYGALTLGGIFEHSSNIGIIRVGLRLGPRRLFEGARSFGVGQSTGIDLPGENTGIFRPLPRWSALSNAEISMGQEVSLNALQLARITAIVANGGKLVQPHVVTRIVEPGGAERALPLPEPSRVLSEATAQSISRILVGVVAAGHGHAGGHPGLPRRGQDGHGAEGRGRRVRRRAPRPQFRGLRAGGSPALCRRRGARRSSGQVLLRGSRRPAVREGDVPGPRHPARRAAGAAGAGDRARRGAGPARAALRQRRGDGVAPRVGRRRGRRAGGSGRPYAERSRDVRPRRAGRVRPHRGPRAPAGLGVRRRPGSASGLAGSSGLGPHPFPRR